MSASPIKKPRSKYRSISVTVDAEVHPYEVLEYLDDDELLEEIAKRKLEQKKVDVADERDGLLGEALDCLRCGDVSEAKLILERILFPKFKSLEACEIEWKKVRTSSVAGEALTVPDDR